MHILKNSRARHLAVATVVAALALRASAGLFDTWGYYADLTFSGYLGAETLAAFPVLVSITNFSGFSYSQVSDAAGGDLRFTDATGGVELNYEVESWDTNGASFVWVQVPALATNASLRAYWGQSAVAAPAYTTNGSTWSNGYVAVWHFAETAGTNLADSAGNYNGLVQGGVSLTEPGCIGSGGRFDGSDDCVALSGLSKIANQGQLTVSGWAKLDTLGSGDPDDSVLFSTSTATDPTLFWYNYSANSTGDKVYSFNVGATSVAQNRANTGSGFVTALVWQHIVGVMSNTSRRIFIDGVQRATSTGTAATTGGTTTGFLGKWSNSASFSFDGAMDEVRLSGVARSADWVRAEYEAVARSSFAAYGAVDASSSPLPGVLSSAASNVSDFSADAVGDLSRLGDSNPTVYLAWGTNPDALSATNNLGVFTQTGGFTNALTGLDCVTTYYYRHFAVNVSGQTESSVRISFTTTGAPVFGTTSASNLLRSAFFSAELLDCGVADATVSLWVGASADALSLTNQWTPVSTATFFSHELANVALGSTLYYAFRAANTYGGKDFVVWTATNAFTVAGSSAWSGAGADTDWHTDGNWSLGVPGAGARADFLAAAKDATVTAAATGVSVGSVSIQTGGALTFDLGADTTLGAALLSVGTNTVSAFTLASGTLDIGSGGVAAGLGSSVTLTGGDLQTSTLRLSGTSTKVVVNHGTALTSSGLATLGGNGAGVHIPTGGVWTAAGVSMTAGPCAVTVDGGAATNAGSLYLGNNSNGADGDILLIKNGGFFRQSGATVQVAVKKMATIIAADGGTFESAATVNLGTGSDWGSPGYLIASNGTVAVSGSVYVCADARYHSQRFFVYEDEGRETSVSVTGGVYLGRGGSAGGDPGNRNNIFRVHGGEVAIGSALIIGGTKSAATNNTLEVKGASTHMTAASMTVTNLSQLVFTLDDSGFDNTPVSISGNVHIDGTTKLSINAAGLTRQGVMTLVESTGGTFTSSIPAENIVVNGVSAGRYEVLQTGALALKIRLVGTLFRIH